MPVAGVVGHGADFRVRVGQQLAGPLQAQFRLFLAEGHAEFQAEQAAEMPLAAVQLRRHVRHGRGGELFFGKLADKPAKGGFQIFLRFHRFIGGAADTPETQAAHNCSNAERATRLSCSGRWPAGRIARQGWSGGIMKNTRGGLRGERSNWRHSMMVMSPLSRSGITRKYSSRNSPNWLARRVTSAAGPAITVSPDRKSRAWPAADNNQSPPPPAPRSSNGYPASIPRRAGGWLQPDSNGARMTLNRTNNGFHLRLFSF